MADDTTRPGAGSPPALDSDRETLLELLQIEKARLRTARMIEEKREIVFPETSVIVRDIMKIMAAINGKNEPTDVGDELGDILRDLEI